MSKRYQVFLSSTFVDLQEERRKIFNALMKMDCIPAGMELFPAADEEQFNFIRKIIDDCDYYVLVVGGRYGSLSETGLSYTEMEYEYAKSAGVQVLAFLPRSPGSITASKTEASDAGRRMLEDFKSKVAANRLVDYWESADDLTSKVVLSLLQTMKTHPALGWVRSDKLNSEGLLLDLNKLRKQNEELRSKLAKSENDSSNELHDLAELSEKFSFEVEYSAYDSLRRLKTYSQSATLTWNDIFGSVATALEHGQSSGALSHKIGSRALRELVDHPKPVAVVRVLNDFDLNTIILQLRALRFIEPDDGQWWLTSHGKQSMLKLFSVKKKLKKKP